MYYPFFMLPDWFCSSHEIFFLPHKLQDLKFNTNTANGNYLCGWNRTMFHLPLRALKMYVLKV